MSCGVRILGTAMAGLLLTAPGSASARKRRVRTLALGGVPPIKENIAPGKHPFAPPLYLVIPRQELISSDGIVSLAEMRR